MRSNLAELRKGAEGLLHVNGDLGKENKDIQHKIAALDADIKLYEANKGTEDLKSKNISLGLLAGVSVVGSFFADPILNLFLSAAVYGLSRGVASMGLFPKRGRGKIQRLQTDLKT